MWMFDAGDGAQRQAILYGDGLSRVNKIFITHLHGGFLNSQNQFSFES